MIALIKETLVRSTRSGKLHTTVVIEGASVDECINEANNFIFARINHKNNYIPVAKFNIEIRTSNRKNSKLLTSYSYVPTYQRNN